MPTDFWNWMQSCASREQQNRPFSVYSSTFRPTLYFWAGFVGPLRWYRSDCYLIWTVQSCSCQWFHHSSIPVFSRRLGWHSGCWTGCLSQSPAPELNQPRRSRPQPIVTAVVLRTRLCAPLSIRSDRLPNCRSLHNTKALADHNR